MTVARKTAMLQVRVTRPQMRTFKQAARRSRLSLSSWVTTHLTAAAGTSDPAVAAGGDAMPRVYMRLEGKRVAAYSGPVRALPPDLDQES